ncbi:hypothetical protein N7468_010697 [Penicillium chermesinum]|uniref:Uncharacterized protein n=1 Tax=Penicillium chermesinum TaxID=63820 RepID=A0A9W9N9P1_9EURO|nr:uncharacterized protein N7468_010697 [Penicillium chermesinum]KAJ5215018.1 hypothetical protein N7468_010697 [Penicillium chermesinum]
MGDAARPSDEEFTQVLEESLNTWTSYLGEHPPFPREAINLESLVSQTPPFLGSGFASSEEISFACEEKESMQGKSSLVVHGRSTWRTSKGSCDLPPRVLPKQLLLATGNRPSVKLSQDSPFSDWPEVQGLSGYDRGNYLSALYFAWAYILSARWVELLGRSADHECHIEYTAQGVKSSLFSDEQSVAQIDLGENACMEEALWWYTILHTDNWNATTKYNNHVYFSPWFISAKDTGLALAGETPAVTGTKLDPPSSVTALNYLSRFCVHHRLYAQCSVALAGVLYIPLLGRRTVTLPFPKQAPQLELKDRIGDSTRSVPDLLNGHGQMLPRYMTLSSNPWGLRSLLHSTFFNPDVKCNLVSAWLNPAFAVVNSVSSKDSSVVALLANRQPQLGILWFGATLVGLAKSVLRDIRIGLMALDLPASAWTETTQTFLTSEVGESHGELICRDDECRLLFITSSEGHDRPPVWTWKPFGFTQLCDTELSVRQHAQCATHCVEYESWEWILTNSSSILNSATKRSKTPIKEPTAHTNKTSAALDDYSYDFYSQELSEGATRGIFGWLRSTGYPRSERNIYQHSWFDLEDTDEEEEPDDAESDMEHVQCSTNSRVDSWLESIE